jgi:hypothetical protein
MNEFEPLDPDGTRLVITGLYRLLEAVIFVGLGVVLFGTALYLLAGADLLICRHLFSFSLRSAAVAELIEQLLLVLLVIEILYPVPVSFREQILASEPFLLIWLIAAVLGVLVIAAELFVARTKTEEAFLFLINKLGMLTLFNVALVSHVIILRPKGDCGEDRRNV